MPRCPRCSKLCKNGTRLLQHMNNPASRCILFLDELVKLSEAVGSSQDNDSERQPESCVVQEDFPMHEPHDYSDTVPLPGQQNSPSDPWFSDAARASTDDYFVEAYPNASQVYGRGETLMEIFDADVNAENRRDNLYYPFASRQEWQMASFLLRSSLSMTAVDEFLSLELVGQLHLSFRTAKELRGRAEILPPGPKWQCTPWTTTYPTKVPLKLFHRDSLDCIQSILHSPLMKDSIHLSPLRVFKTAEKIMRVYSQWMTGDVAWDMQNQLPSGATLLGTILSSDKTNISAMTGNRQAHPLLISLANLDMDFRMKGSHHAFLLIALLPVPKFIHPTEAIRGVLWNRLIHECIDYVVEPLKKAASIGIMMSDPLGSLRYCFTPLVSCIVDTPESAVYACVAGKTSSVTMANYKQFGDSFQHEPRTASTTLAQIQALESKIDPWNLPAYIEEVKAFHLNGVHRPFWRDWPLAQPSLFLTPEALHHWHRMFWDHDAKWCIRAVGRQEIDFRFSVLQPHIGLRHFKEGISALKQVTGREHRDIQRYIIGVIAGAVPKEFLVAVRALMDFRYMCQAQEIDEDGCNRILAALHEFHTYKQAVIEAGARVGKKNKPINNWHIPKLEFLQSVVPNIRANGAPIQWSADVTERAHITQIKNPARSSNNQEYENQICRNLDRADKCRRFDLATSVRDARVNFREAWDVTDGCEVDDDDNDGGTDNQYINSTSSLLSHIQPVANLSGPVRVTDYFSEAQRLHEGAVPNAPHPCRTFANVHTAFHLTRDPSFKQMTIDAVAQMFGLPDLRPALADFLQRLTENPAVHVMGGRRRALSGCSLPFEMLQVWSTVRIQSKAYHNRNEVLPPQTVSAAPCSESWPLGRYDGVLVNTDPDMHWPWSGLKGHCVAQIRLIMRIVPPKGRGPAPGTEGFFVYAQRFDIVPQLNPSFSARYGPYPDPVTSMYLLKRCTRTDGSRMGDIISLGQLRCAVELTPSFGKQADRRLTKESSLEYSNEFWLAGYFDKETFFALH